jgi:hypothetical protein
MLTDFPEICTFKGISSAPAAAGNSSTTNANSTLKQRKTNDPLQD